MMYDQIPTNNQVSLTGVSNKGFIYLEIESQVTLIFW